MKATLICYKKNLLQTIIKNDFTKTYHGGRIKTDKKVSKLKPSS